MSAAQAGADAADRQADADAELTIVAASATAATALRAGTRAPLFSLADANGKQITLEDLLLAGPVVLHFFRGNWCSFGEQSLTEFAATYRQIIAAGANAVAIAPTCMRTKQHGTQLMPELVDIDMKVARAYGLAFELPGALRPRYEALGYTPPSTAKEGSWLAPVPATYLLDRDGTVALAFVDVDYRKHVATDSLLTAVKALQTRQVARSRSLRMMI